MSNQSVESALESLQTALDFGPDFDQSLIKAEIHRLEEDRRLARKGNIPSVIQDILDDPAAKILIAFSGGKDSVAMFLYVHKELGIPTNRLELWHHEIDGRGEPLFDWPCTPSYCKAFADEFGVDILFSYREGGIAREIYRENEGLQDVFFQDQPGGEFIQLKSQPGNSTKRRFPAVSAKLSVRWCSAVVKIDVMSRCINNSSRFKEGNFIVCSGERREESKNRAQYNEHEDYRSKTQKRNIYQWRPVIDWTEEEVWGMYRKYKVQAHPCYELGYPRCSCATCIFLGTNGWASTAEILPERPGRFSEIETDIGFTLYPNMGIFDKIAKGKSYIDQIAKQRWGNEIRTKFSSPIILKHWLIPAGAFKNEKAGSV